MNTPRSQNQPPAAGTPPRQHGLTLIELLVAIVLSVAILSTTTAVMHMIVKRQTQIQAINTQHLALAQFKQRLESESSETVKIIKTTPLEWVFVSSWRVPGEPWQPRQTQLSCQKDPQSNNWHLVLAHLYTESPSTTPAAKTGPGNQPLEWGRVGPWQQCNLQVGTLQPLPGDPNSQPAKALIWEQAGSQTAQGPIPRYRIRLHNTQGPVSPWVIHVQ